MIDLYAITQAPGPSLRGLAPLRVLASGRLAIVYAPAAGGEVTADALWHHEEAIEALMAEHDVLPFRYGTRCEDEAAASRAIEAREAELATTLERIRGAVELSVRVMTMSPVGPRRAPDASPAEYLACRERASTQVREAAEGVHEPLAALARASRQRTGSEPSEVLRGAYLVERDEVDHFARTVAQLQSRCDHLRLLCTGPWPPYSFAQP